MKLADFDYNLPKEFIAQYPLLNRQESKMLVLERKTGKISHHKFTDLLDYFNPSDILILNDTKVFPARMLGRKKDTGGKVEIFLLNCIKENLFNALVRPAQIKQNQRVIFDNNIEAEVVERNIVSFNTKNIKKIYKQGNIPLPPYIKRHPENLDISRYQTVYAKKEGAVAAPTAGLHFSKEILSKIKKSKINIGHLTLHVGWGTFKPLRSENIAGHQMEREYFDIPEKTLNLITTAKKKGGRVFVVGTTAARALESFAKTGKSKGWTDLFIYPGFNFEIVNCLLTNFHLPRSSLLMLVCAFASSFTEKKSIQIKRKGVDLVMSAYNQAIKNKYRFYSYGDCMLII